MPKKKSGQTVHSLSTLPYYAVVYHKNTPSARVFSRKMAGFSGIFASNGGKAGGAHRRAPPAQLVKKGRCPFLTKEISLRPARPNGLLAHLGTLSPRKVFFATYTPPRKMIALYSPLRRRTLRGIFDSLRRTALKPSSFGMDQKKPLYDRIPFIQPDAPCPAPWPGHGIAPPGCPG